MFVALVALVLVPSAVICRSVSTESADSVASALLAEAQPSRQFAVLTIGQQPSQTSPPNVVANDDVDIDIKAASADASDADASQHRQRRQSPYNVPSSNDYYSNYYNDYYNNYYNNLNGGAVANSISRPPAATNYRPASADRFDGNANAIDSGNGGFASDGRPQQQVINGQKYVYTPLFQYKATQGHHQKLFVPNLFG